VRMIARTKATVWRRDSCPPLWDRLQTPDSITRLKSAIIFSLMIDGSGSLRFQEVRAGNEFKKRPK
jgi:hypothetical protein